MEKLKPRVKKHGIAYEPEVLTALDDYARQFFKGNRSKAQNYIN
jgi:hypothetical protein